MEEVSLAEHIAHAVTNRGLKLILNPTEQCNLRCKYCYESFELRQMTTRIVNGVLAFVERRASAGLDWLEVEFFGGEPLAAWKVVADLSEGISETCRRHSVKLLGGMTTNLTLLNQLRLDLLARCGFTFFQVTLDGPRAIHDSRRVTLGSKGTFEDIWKNLLLLKESDYPLEVMMRIHFDASTFAALDSSGFIREVAHTFVVGDERFSLHFNPLEPWGRAARAGVAFFPSQAATDEALAALLSQSILAGVSLRQLPQSDLTMPTGESGHIVCYAARANSFVIRSDGRISKCTVALDSPKNTIGRLLPSGELEIDHDRHLPWLRGLISGNADNLSCPAIGFV
jgi:uncharacterized protein